MKDWADHKNDEEKLLGFFRKPEKKSSTKPIKTSGFIKLTTSCRSSSSPNETKNFNIASNVITELSQSESSDNLLNDSILNVSQEIFNAPSNMEKRKLLKIKLAVLLRNLSLLWMRN